MSPFREAVPSLPNAAAPHVVVTLNHIIIVLLLHNCNFATAVNHTVNI